MLTVYKDMRTASISLNISWFNNYNIPIICNKIVLCIFEIYFDDSVQLLHFSRAYVVYLSAYRAVSVFAGILSLGREGFGTCQTDVSAGLGGNFAASLLLSVCF